MSDCERWVETNGFPKLPLRVHVFTHAQQSNAELMMDLGMRESKLNGLSKRDQRLW